MKIIYLENKDSVKRLNDRCKKETKTQKKEESDT